MTPAPVDHDERRARLTEVLLALVSEEGMEGASVRKVAARAGVSIGTVQHYFATKDEMLRHAYRRAGEQLGEAADAAGRSATTIEGAIRGILLELLPLDERRTAALRVSISFAERSLHAPELGAEMRADLAELQRAIEGLFEQTGVADPALEARLALAVVSGLSEPLLWREEGFGPDEVVAALDAHLARVLPAAAG